MSEYTPGIYRGQSAGCFGLWRLTPEGHWLFSMPVNGDTWHPARLPQDELDGLVLIAADADTGPLTAHDAEVRAQALEDAAAAVAEMERAFVTSEWGTVVRKLDARDMLRGKARKAKELLASWEPVESREDDRGWLSKIQVDISTRIRALATPVEPTPADVERIRDEYFETLAKLDPSPEMARIIEQAKRDLAIRKNRSSDS